MESEISPEQERDEHKKKRLQLLEQQEAYAKAIKQFHKPKVSEALTNEREMRIKQTNKEEFKKKKIEIQNSPYKDYIKEGIRQNGGSTKAVESNKSPTSSKIMPINKINL